MRRRLLTAVSFALAFGLAAAASAATPAERRAATLGTAQAAQIPSFVKKARSGAERVVINPSGWGHLQAVERLLPQGSNVLEIMHIGASDAYHTMALFDRQLVHTQYISSNWRLRDWGDRLRPSGRPLYSALVHLTDSEAERLRGFIAAAWKEQGPEHAAGDNWERGHIRVSLGGPRYLNCVSTWSEMPVGDHGEPLWKLMGLPGSFSGNPPGLQRALEHDANERVFGLSLYGPAVPNFGADPQAPIFTF
jgi:hypothetical protein